MQQNTSKDFERFDGETWYGSRSLETSSKHSDLELSTSVSYKS